jgi:hypothetical protein
MHDNEKNICIIIDNNTKKLLSYYEKTRLILCYSIYLMIINVFFIKQNNWDKALQLKPCEKIIRILKTITLEKNFLS